MMTPEIAVGLVGHAVQITALIVCVLVVPSLLGGLLVSVFQAATQINEMTLTFIPKLLAMFLVLVLAGPWMLRTLIEYTTRLLSSIPNMIG